MAKKLSPLVPDFKARFEPFIVEYIRCGRVQEACKTVGIDYAEFYKMLRKLPELRPDYDTAKEIVHEAKIDALEEKAFAAALAGNVQLLMFLLKTHRPQRYAERQIVDLVGEASVKVYGSLDVESV